MMKKCRDVLIKSDGLKKPGKMIGMMMFVCQTSLWITNFYIILRYWCWYCCLCNQSLCFKESLVSNTPNPYFTWKLWPHFHYTIPAKMKRNPYLTSDERLQVAHALFGVFGVRGVTGVLGVLASDLTEGLSKVGTYDRYKWSYGAPTNGRK